MPNEVKEKAREISDWILRQPGFLASVEKYKELAKQLAAHHTLRTEALNRAAEKAYEDIRDRVAQIVLRGASAMKAAESKERKMDTTKLTNYVWRSAWRALERERLRAEAQLLLAAEREMQRKRRESERSEKAREV